jgi:hypothetical protein
MATPVNIAVATFVKGDIVVLPFPFLDISASKRGPALVLSTRIHLWCLPYQPGIRMVLAFKHIDQVLRDNRLGQKIFPVPEGIILNMVENQEFSDLPECHQLEVALAADSQKP